MQSSEVSPKEPLLLSGSNKSLRNLCNKTKLEAFEAKLRNPSSRDRDFFKDLSTIMKDKTLTCRDFVEALVEQMDKTGDIADPRQDNKTPLMLAAANGNLPALDLLLPKDHDDPETLRRRLEADDDMLWTALHVAVNAVCTAYGEANATNGTGKGDGKVDVIYDVIADRIECVAFLLKRHKDWEVHMGTQEQNGRPALYLAAKSGPLELVQEFLKYDHIGLDIVGPQEADGTRSSSRQLIKKRFPKIAAEIDMRVEDKQVPIGGVLVQLLERDDPASQNEFCLKVDALDANDRTLQRHYGNSTLMQRACFSGRHDAVKALLKKSPVLAERPQNAVGVQADAPLFIAAERGFKEVLKAFYDRARDQFKKTTPHKDTVLIALVRKFEDSEERYHECLELLLKYEDDIVNINAVNNSNDSALHLAALNRLTRVSAALLRAGAWLGRNNKFKIAPLGHLSADTLKAHLDTCVTCSGVVGKEERKISFDYTCLRAPPSPPKLPLVSGKAVTDAESQSAGAVDLERREMEALYALSQNKDKEMRRLLLHPVLHSFLDYKWGQIQNIYYTNVVFYAMFVFFITWHILEIGGHPQDQSCWVRGCAMLTFLFLVVREVAQGAIGFCRYVHDPENWLELVLIGCVGIVFAYHGPYKRVFAAAAILFVWGELMLLLGRHPRCAVYVEMLKTVAWNFLKFLGWFVCLIVAFSLCFFTLFRADPTPPASSNGASTNDAASNTTSTGPFSDFWLSTFKTLVMMTGELNVEAVPLDGIPGLSHTVFLMFVFLVVIVLLNLLNGLAVSDTQAIKDVAELVCCASRVDMAAAVENALITWLHRCPWLKPILKRIIVSTFVFQTSDADTTAYIIPHGDCTLRFGPDKDEEQPSDYCCLQALPGRAGKSKCCRVSREVVIRAEEVLAAREARSELSTEVERVAKEMEDRLAKRLEEVGKDVASALRAALAEIN